MNQYKIAQSTFDFYRDIPRQKSPQLEETEEYRRLKERTPAMMNNLLESVTGYTQIVDVLKSHRLQWKRTGSSIAVNMCGDVYIIDSFDFPVLRKG